MKLKTQILLITIICGSIFFFSGCSKRSEEALLLDAQKALDESKYEDVVNNLNQLIRNYPKSQNAPKAYYNIGIVYLLYQNEQERAKKVWVRLQQKYPQFDLEKEFFDYAQKLQDEGKPEWAIILYDEILSLFAESSNMEKALFLKGFVYSEELKDYDKAKEIYQMFIEKYPESELTDDAEFMLENMGKEPELGK